MLKKYVFSVCLALVLSINTSSAEEFVPYHPRAFAGFWIHNPILNLEKLLPVTEGTVRNTLWSDDYWAIYAGGLAYRYAAPGFWINPNKPKPNDWKIPSEYILKKMPAEKMVRANRTHLLSPAEKYDLLVGDTGNPKNPKQSGYTLTRSFLSQITAKTQPWEGSCDGWAFASMNEKPPVRSVKVKNVAGQEILFYPSDIRALLTLLYSDYRISSFGSDCYDKKPASDRSGRLLEQGCRDTNPGVFHAVLVNQVGIGKRGFTMDTDYSAETWNYPVKSYKLQYYNPQTNQSYVDPKHSAVAIENFTRDRYAAHRSDRVASVIGVNVQLEYHIEALPMPTGKLDQSYERSFTNGYRYDLELDADGNIIGGEWHGQSQRNHPDLLSFVSTNYINKSPYDRQIRGNTLPQILRSLKPQFIAGTSGKRRPLYKVVKALAAMSQ